MKAIEKENNWNNQMRYFWSKRRGWDTGMKGWLMGLHDCVLNLSRAKGRPIITGEIPLFFWGMWEEAVERWCWDSHHHYSVLPIVTEGGGITILFSLLFHITSTFFFPHLKQWLQYQCCNCGCKEQRWFLSKKTGTTPSDLYVRIPKGLMG